MSAEEHLSGRRLSAGVGDSKESVTMVRQADGAASSICTENTVLALLASGYIRDEIRGRALMLSGEEDANRRTISKS